MKPIGQQKEPISRLFGYDRGKPIDRYYIETFLENYRNDIRGAVLEIGDSQYTTMFANKRIEESKTLHVSTGETSDATMTGNLETGEGIPSNSFDCVILTQTLNVIFEVRKAISTIFKTLRPGGVLLCTIPGISQISRYDMDRWGDYWRFTSLSAKKLFEEVFLSEHTTVVTYGNVLSAAAFLYGLATEELAKKDLDYFDHDYEMLIGVRAMKT